MLVYNIKMIDFFSPGMIVLYALLLGVTTKIADLLDEHGLKWFKGDALLFGILWGFFGSVLVASNNIIANVILAMNLSYILRGSLDYLNHRIASVMIIIAFLVFATFDARLFAIALVFIIIFGFLEDSITNYVKPKGALKKTAVYFNDALIYYIFFTFVYALLYNEWILFFAFTAYVIGYDFTKYYARSKGYK